MAKNNYSNSTSKEKTDNKTSNSHKNDYQNKTSNSYSSKSATDGCGCNSASDQSDCFKKN